MKWPELWLCLDLFPMEGTKIPPGEDIASLVLNPDVNCDGWLRDWKVFPTEAMARAHESDAAGCIIVVPLVLEGKHGN